MAVEVELSNLQRFVLTRFAQTAAHEEEEQPHWAVILLAVDDKYATTNVEERTGASTTLVATVAEKWNEGQETLTKAEAGGVLALQSAIENIFENYEDFESECFCCCDESSDDEVLSPYELEMLAGKVYNLLRMELMIERERLGYAYFSRN